MEKNKYLFVKKDYNTKYLKFYTAKFETNGEPRDYYFVSRHDEEDLALLNKEGVVATCEGDVPTMISMHLLNKLTNQVGFQANPSRIDVENKKMILAHCTLPLNMVNKYNLDTHFESGIGVAIKGYLKEEKVTIFKLSKNLKDYYVTTGTIIKNLEESNLCRTQIEVSIDDNIEYFLNRPYGNHHVVIYGDYKNDIIKYMSKL